MAQHPSLTPATLVVRKDMLSADIGGEIVMMSVEAGRYYGLDAIGSDIWTQLATPVRIDALCARLEADYDAEATRIESDVMSLLNTMLAQGLIEIRT